MTVTGILPRVQRLAVDRRTGLVSAAAVMVLGALTAWALRHTYYGDPGIYLPYARNAAHGDFFSFNPHQFSSGSTSPLWPLVLAPSWVVGAGAGGAKVIAAAVMVAAVGLVVAAAQRVTGSLTGAALAAFVLFPSLGFLGSVLYETPLAVALVALSVLAGARLLARADRGTRLDVRGLAPLALVWAALPLARPEAAFLVPLQAALLWRKAGRGGWRDARSLLLAVLVAALPALAYYLYSQATLGTFSTSSQARTFALREGGDRLGPLFLTRDGIDFITSTPFVFAFVPGVAGLWLLTRDAATRWVGVYGAAALLVYVLFVTFVSPAGYETGRYLMPAIPFVVIGVARAFASLSDGRLALPALVVLLALVVWPAAHDTHDEVRTQRALGYTLDNIAEGEAARDVNRIARPGDTVLSYEVQVRYLVRDGVRVLSLDGVTDGRVHGFQTGDRLAAFLWRERPRFWISSDPGTLGLRPYLRRSFLERVARRFTADRGLRQVTARGITFRLLARRTTPMPRLFGGWRALFELTYAGAS